MPDTKYAPGAVVTVAALEVNDTVFLRETNQGVGLPVPTHPARVTDLEPRPNGHVSVSVVAANAGAAEPRLLGYLPPTREFRRAVPVAQA